MNLSLNVSQKLEQKLSQQMIQSLKLLQMNTLQLEQTMKTELEINPMLEAEQEIEEIDEEQSKDEEDSPDEGELEVDEEGVDWDEYLEDGFDMNFSYSGEEYDPEKEKLESSSVYQTTLEEHLTEQLNEKKLPEDMRILVELLIGSLDDDGYLRMSLNELAEDAGVSVYKMEEALNILWGMDPSGVGARSLQESLLIQLRNAGKRDTLTYRIVSEKWELATNNRVPEIAKYFDCEVDDVKSAFGEISKLDPHPGSHFSVDTNSAITPDVIVKKVDGKFEVILNDNNLPMININRKYAEMIKRGSGVDPKVKKYLRERYNSANWLVRSIEQRKATIIKVVEAIVDKQKNFFRKGPPNLVPMKQQDIADEIGMHVSTVNRVANGKFVQTPYGIFEIKYFFTEGLKSENGGDDVSSRSIKKRIKELVDEEPPSKPLSDQKISDILKKEGFKVARRTVAKYREQARIPTARMRKKYE